MRIRPLCFGLSLFLLAMFLGPPRGEGAGLGDLSSWTKAREDYFRQSKDPVRPYRIDGVRGKVLDLRFYSCPDPEMLLVTYGESYENTTGWDQHISLVRRDGKAVYPGNVHLSPVGADMTLDWMDTTTLGIFYRAGFYPDRRDRKTGVIEKIPGFKYQKKVDGITVRFIAVDLWEFDERSWKADSRRLSMGESELVPIIPDDVPEHWSFSFDSRSWVTGSRPTGSGQSERVYVPEGQTMGIWREMVTSGLAPGGLKEHLLWFDQWRDHVSRECPSFDYEVVEKSATAILIEWRHDGCAGEPPMYRLLHLVETPGGVLGLSYSAKTQDVPEERWKTWRELLRAARPR